MSTPPGTDCSALTEKRLQTIIDKIEHAQGKAVAYTSIPAHGPTLINALNAAHYSVKYSLDYTKGVAPQAKGVDYFQPKGYVENTSCVELIYGNAYKAARQLQEARWWAFITIAYNPAADLQDALDCVEIIEKVLDKPGGLEELATAAFCCMVGPYLKNANDKQGAGTYSKPGCCK